jgi:hypothetical protein
VNTVALKMVGGGWPLAMADGPAEKCGVAWDSSGYPRRGFCMAVSAHTVLRRVPREDQLKMRPGRRDISTVTVLRVANATGNLKEVNPFATARPIETDQVAGLWEGHGDHNPTQKGVY